MIEGVHPLLYAHDDDAARGIRAGREKGRTEIDFMCSELEATKRELEATGVEFVDPVTDEGWGLLTRFRVPEFGEVGLYEPRHPTLLPTFS